jgi:hypothetical protein
LNRTALGLELMNIAGPDVPQAAINSLGDEIDDPDNPLPLPSIWACYPTRAR